jgi:hypothetical protein
MINHHRRRISGTVKKIVGTATLFLATSILLLWAWNTLAVDLFQMPVARFKHAAALCGLVTTAFMLRFSVANFASDKPSHSRHFQDTSS